MKIGLSHLLTLIFAGWMIFNLVQTANYITGDYSGVPIADYWRVPEVWPQYKDFHFAGLWRQHNEHRIIFPELTYFADMLLLRGRMYLPIALSGFCYLGVWCVLVWAAYSKQWSYRTAALLLAGALIAWKGCSSVIATGFQLSFTMLEFVSALALAALAKLSDTGAKRYLVLVIGLAAIATYTSGNGLALWAVLLSVALFLRVDKRHTLALAIAAVVFIGPYFIGYRFPSGGNLHVSLGHPLVALEFVCSYMSMPFGGFGPKESGIAIGAISLSLMSLCFVLAWRQGIAKSKLGILIFGLYLFTLLSAMLTASGRVDLNDSGFGNAKVWRYVAMPTVAWALLAVALIWLLGGRESRIRPFVTAVIAIFFGWGFLLATPWVETTRVDLANAQIVATMLRNEVFAPSVAATIFPSSELVRVLVKVLQDDRKSIYARGSDKWIGQNVSQLHPHSTPIPGGIARVYPIPGGLQILGWADSGWLTGDHAVLFVDDATGRIVGYGRQPTPGFPADLAGWDVPAQLAFVGFARIANPGGQHLSVYVRTSHGKYLWPLASKIEVPEFTSLETPADTAPLTGISWQLDANWTFQSFRPDPAGSPLLYGDVYTSGAPNNQPAGAIRTAAFPVPANHCLVLPVLHGASTYGQSVEVRNADTNAPIAKLPMLDGQSVWTRWRIPIPPNAFNLVVAANDAGREAFQWTTIATPRACP